MKKQALVERILAEGDFDLFVEHETIPVRGNAMASEDPEYNRQVEDEILSRLENGDVWAWASVRAEGRWNGLVEWDSLGCCSYEDREAFLRDGYWADMKLGIAQRIAEEFERIGKKYVEIQE